MNQLYVEANKSFRHGFVLPESELRRFIELIREQVKKINADPDLSFRYQLKFQNGVVAETDSIDSILSQENEGPEKLFPCIFTARTKKTILFQSNSTI